MASTRSVGRALYEKQCYLWLWGEDDARIILDEALDVLGERPDLKLKFSSATLSLKYGRSATGCLVHLGAGEEFFEASVDALKAVGTVNVTGLTTARLQRTDG